ncbi:MAG: pyridoxamine 5'-phosphate oxidase family protein [Paracoccaceae bacterium]
MADETRAKTDAKQQLFDQLSDVKAGMLGVAGSGQHMQPMAPRPEPEAGLIWFITGRSTDLVQSLAPGGSTAHFTFIGAKDDYWACLKGRLEQVEDEAKLDELWTIMAAGWFEHGREDADVTLIRLTLEDAEVWASTRNPVTFAIEMAKGYRDGQTADLGAHEMLEWRPAA